jgi:hypothetical protein
MGLLCWNNASMFSTLDLSPVGTTCHWISVWLHLRLTDKTQVDLELGAQLICQTRIQFTD